jgi:hypothetical protein
MPLSIIQTSYLIMNQVFLAAIMVITTLSVVGIVASSIAIAQNMSGGTPEKAKLPAEQNMTGNATNTTITEGVSPNFTG